MKIVYHPEYQSYNFGPGHPFSPKRLAVLLDLFDALGRPLEFITPTPATDDDLLTVHTEEYLNVVGLASMLAWTPDAKRYGIDTHDVPIFAGMDEATRWIVGGTLEGAREVLRSSNPVLQLGGGLHHAHAALAAGFCVYNDQAVATQYLRQQGLRVAYIDVDVHHGDGVQWVHFNDPDVLTISLHESGLHLFPGTGMVVEMQNGQSVVNIPLAMHTDDASFLEAFEAVVPHALEQFKPDVIVYECGVDAHMQDPLAHLNLTTHGYEKLFTLLMQMTAYYADGRGLYSLGGGYNMDATVRSWALLIHLLMDWPLPAELPDTWRTRWKAQDIELSANLHDQISPEIPDLEAMRTTNQETVQQALELL